MSSKSLQFIHSSAYSVLLNQYDEASKVKKPTLTFKFFVERSIFRTGISRSHNGEYKQTTSLFVVKNELI
jgi:hypothetical protein